MQIAGHGIDIVDTDRIARMRADHGPNFMDRCFTDAEQAEAARYENDRRKIQYVAGRFAAKEAVLKALGTGWSDGIAWTDVEVLGEPSGRPVVTLHRLCKQIAVSQHIDQWWISISHIETHATASAIAVRSHA